MADKYGRGSDLPTGKNDRGDDVGGGPFMKGSDYKTPNKLNGSPDDDSGHSKDEDGKWSLSESNYKKAVEQNQRASDVVSAKQTQEENENNRRKRWYGK